MQRGSEHRTNLIVLCPSHLQIQEKCNGAVHVEPILLAYVPDRFKTQGMYSEAVRNKLFLPNLFKTMEICNKIMHTMPKAFHHIPDRFKIQEICDKAFEEDPSSFCDTTSTKKIMA